MIKFKKEYRMAKIGLITGIILFLAYDAWVILSGNLDLSKHVPGFPELALGIWLYGVRMLEKAAPIQKK